ncbi:hypothetical protein BJ741DRAFT_153374 [Chytriomyces cf. hyalinus JEL632]|nr:hypothetical protein BJ741DRAFT_153374 [Chytriomyces cf. hyalinus JEL632]
MPGMDSEPATAHRSVVAQMADLSLKLGQVKISDADRDTSRDLRTWAENSWAVLLEFAAVAGNQSIHKDDSNIHQAALRLFLALSLALNLDHKAFVNADLLSSIKDLCNIASTITDQRPRKAVGHRISSILNDANNKSLPQRATLDALVQSCSPQDLANLPQPETLVAAVLLGNTQLIALLLPLPSTKPQYILNAIHQAVNANQSAALQLLLDSSQCPKLESNTLHTLLQTSIRKSQLSTTRDILARGPLGLIFDAIGFEHIIFLCYHSVGIETAQMLEFLLSKDIHKITRRDPQARLEPLEQELPIIWNASSVALACMGQRSLRIDRLSRKDALGLAMSRAALCGNLWCLRVLVEHGVDPKWRRGVPVRMAALGSHTECVDYLQGAAAGTNHGKWYRGFREALASCTGKDSMSIVNSVAEAGTSAGDHRGNMIGRLSVSSNRRTRDAATSSSRPKQEVSADEKPLVQNGGEGEMIPMGEFRGESPASGAGLSVQPIGASPPPPILPTNVRPRETSASKKSYPTDNFSQTIPSVASVVAKSPIAVTTSALTYTPSIIETPISTTSALIPMPSSMDTRPSTDGLSLPRPMKQVEFKELEYTRPTRAYDRQMSQMSSASVGNISLHTPDLIRLSNATPDSMVASIRTEESYVSAYGSGRSGSIAVLKVREYSTTLMSLPDSVLYGIVFYLKKEDLAFFTSTCRRLSQVCLSVDFMASYVVHSLGAFKALVNVFHSPESDERMHLLTSVMSRIPTSMAPDLVTNCIETNEPQIIPFLFSRGGTALPLLLPFYILKAVEMRDVDCLNVFLTHPNADVDSSGALVAAMSHGDGAVVDALLQAGANVKVNECAALRSLCAMPSNSAVQDMTRSFTGASELTTDMLRGGVNRANLAGKLILAGSDVSARNYEAFKSAAKVGDEELLRVLLKEVLTSIPVAVGTGTVRPVRTSSAGLKEQAQRLLFAEIYMTVSRHGHHECVKLLLSEPRTYVGGEIGLNQVVIPAVLVAVRSGWVGVVKAVASSALWLDIIKSVGGDVLLDTASRYKYAHDPSLPEQVNERKQFECPIIQIDGDIVIPHSAAMVEAMLAGVAGNTAARFTAFETTIMKKGIDCYAFLSGVVKLNERSSPFQGIKDSLLVHSAWLGHETVMDAVVSILQPDLAGVAGESALMAATMMGHTKIVASLFSGGVQFDRVSEIAFHIATDRGHKETVKYLTVMRDVRVKMAKDAVAKREKEAKDVEERKKRPSIAEQTTPVVVVAAETLVQIPESDPV